MSTPKHTPGPWHIGVRYSSTYVEGPNGRGICSAGSYTDSRVDPEVLHNESIANAHLIAAAPEMLEALKAALPFVSQFTDEASDVAVAMIGDAIAKAEGRS